MLGRTRVLALAALVCLFAMPAAGHFLLNLNVRILHVEHLEDGLRVYLRTPMPYLVADRVGPQTGADALPEPAPYTTNRMEEDRLVHYLDLAALNRDPEGLGRFAADGFRFEAEGVALSGAVEQVRAHPVGAQPPFATLEEAKAVFADPSVFPADTAPPYVGDVVLDLVLYYRMGGPVYDYTIASTLDPGLPGQESTANLILDYSPGDTKVFRARGLLDEPVAISRSLWGAVLTFVVEGVRHILEGVDHVLFVLCLALGAVGLRSLIWRVTGFTIGHSVTLSLGFFGYTPGGAWFIPAVETGIALSILYAAAIAVWVRQGHRRSGPSDRTETTTFLVTTAIGLLHGLGFSFVLQEILQVGSPNIWQSLLAFNLGVELGQVLIILLVWPLFRLVARLNDTLWRAGRWSIAGGCGAIALYWTIERGATVFTGA